MSLRITLNGSVRDLALDSPSVRDLVLHLGLEPSHVVVEVNGEIVTGSEGGLRVNMGDVVEIVRFMGGGSDASDRHIVTDAFVSVFANMNFDGYLLATLPQNTHRVRIYGQIFPGITYSYKQDCETQFSPYFSAQRLTGGGIVFHSKGDILLSVFGFLSDPVFPDSLKEKMAWYRDQIRDFFSSQDIHLTSGAEHSQVDIDFCQHYPNPYELYYEGDKIVAITIRKYRDRFIMQGILHIESNWDSFVSLQDDYGRYFSKGLVSVNPAKRGQLLHLLEDWFRQAPLGFC